MKMIVTDQAPKAVGPYAQAVRYGDTVFCSGQLGLDPATGKLVGSGVEAQTRQVLVNLKAVLQATGLRLDHVVKTTIYVIDMKDYAKVNQIYAEAFGTHTPARATVQVAGLPMDGLVEIDCIAVNR